MLSYCLKCSKNAESKNPKVARTKAGRIMLLWQCVMCESKKSNLSKSKRLVVRNSLGIKTPWSKIPLVGSLLF